MMERGEPKAEAGLPHSKAAAPEYEDASASSVLVPSGPKSKIVNRKSKISNSVQRKKAPDMSGGLRDPGDDLLSHTVSHAVSSALEGLTAVFEMGTGVSPPPRSPESR